MLTAQPGNNFQSSGSFFGLEAHWFSGTPALVAMVIRLQIPESPRNTMDVLLNGKNMHPSTKLTSPPIHCSQESAIRVVVRQEYFEPIGGGRNDGEYSQVPPGV